MADGRTSVPGEPAGQRSPAWFRSPAGVLTHADGPSQVRAFVGRGYTEVDEAEARKEIGDGLRLEVDPTGSFDADAVAKAVADEGSQETARAKRSAAARKGAETKRRKAEAAAAAPPAEGSTGS